MVALTMSPTALPLLIVAETLTVLSEFMNVLDSSMELIGLVDVTVQST